MTDDTISRAVALKGLEDLNIASFYEENEHSKEAYTEVKAMLKALPSAQPKDECEYWDSESSFCALHRPSALPELSPCDVCRYYPPSSMDGKPCTICPAERKNDE